jgi:hypothetical protein
VVTCQAVRELWESFQGTTTIKLDETYNWANIELYIKKRLGERASLQQRFESLEIDPLEYFRSRFQGMFLWVSMILTELDGALSPEDFREILRHGPENVNACMSV